MNILLLGYGISNQSLMSHFKNDNVKILDDNYKNNKMYLSYDELKKCEQKFDLTIRSPGFFSTRKEYSLSKLLSKELISEVEYALRKIKSKHIIAVTGTNGKTTTAMMIYHILSKYRKCFLVGNIGVPISSIIDFVEEDDIVILEISSFQLEDTYSFDMEVKIITNLEPNHLDGYVNLESYYASKLRLINFGNSKMTILDKKLAQLYKSDFSVEKKNNKFNIFNEDYNNLNFSIAIKVCEYYGISKEISCEEIKSFSFPIYRNQKILHNGKLFVNDSKSTSLSSTNACIDNMKKDRRIIILGGINKSESFINLHKTNNDLVLTFGRDGKKIGDEISSINFVTLKELMIYVKSIVNKYEVVIFSPGCSSFDQYKNYIERGKEFEGIIKEWF